ncbi:MAG TPA: Gfo/Idh/MocA family oxidoreductase [Streptosporangiaceae bacterium]|nr:Gfo/Idh/MocA family oxidoreductase [Streptosporangiaceae bacterium]
MAPIRLGVIGAGVMGDRVARAAAALDAYTVTAVADADPGRGAALAGELGAAAFPGVGELLAAGLVDAVYVGVPHHLHLPVCLQAAAAGVHGLVDKPLCNTDAEAGAIEAAVLSSGATWMVGFSYRFRAEWQRARELVAAGRIGEPVAVTDVIAEAAEHTPAWYWDPGSGGGVLQLQAHHCFDRIAWLTDRPIREVSCRVHAPPSGAATAAQITARLEGGAVAGIALTFGTSYAAPVRALFVLQGATGQLEITQDGCLTLSTADGGLTAHYGGDDWLSRELADFAGAVERGEPSTATLADGRAALRCALAAAQSAATHASVTVVA